MDKLFDNKRKHTGYDGETYIDLVIPSVDVSKIKGNGVLRISQDDEGRIDTFTWNNVATDMNAIDIVMYANHIFNPFSMKSGELVYMPSTGDDIYVGNEEPSLPDGTKYSNEISGEKTMTYAEKIEYLAKNGYGIK